jgi:hypothetical protein
MIPIDQTITGPRGNCFSACLASLLEIPIESVPLFLSEVGDRTRFDWASRLDEWLENFGLYALHFSAIPGSPNVMPAVLHIMTGISPRGRPHAVIGKGHQIVHDPHPDRSGLSEVDGYVLLVPRWEKEAANPSVAFLQDAERVLDDIEAFRSSLGPRDLMLLQIGLHASHMEEAIVAGDELRAKAHLYALVDLVQRLQGAS